MYTIIKAAQWPVLTLFLLASTPVFSQTATDTLTPLLLGRWEVVAYSEQGVQVDKRQPAMPQALAVYDHIRRQRAERWYGYAAYMDYSRRQSRDFDRWSVLDSLQETSRVAEAIALPYYAVFFADSTLAMYNKEATTNRIYFPEARHFTFSPTTRSLDVFPIDNAFERWQVQILLLTTTRMTLFLPEGAEVVELVKTPFTLP